MGQIPSSVCIAAKTWEVFHLICWFVYSDLPRSLVRYFSTARWSCQHKFKAQYNAARVTADKCATLPLDLYVFQAKYTPLVFTWMVPSPLQLVQWSHWIFSSWMFKTRVAGLKTYCSMWWAPPPMVSSCSQGTEKRLSSTRLATSVGETWRRKKCVLCTAEKSPGEPGFCCFPPSHQFSALPTLRPSELSLLFWGRSILCTWHFQLPVIISL